MFIKTNTPLPLLQSTLISARHGFATRHGGVSQAPHLSSLNIGSNLGDDIRSVQENRRRLFAQLGADTGKSVMAEQVHSNTVHTIHGAEDIRAEHRCDGFVTKETGIVLLIKTADCTPILLHDPLSGVIGALHAGWRGSVAGIAVQGVRAMQALGAKAEHIRVAIGPCIHPCCYEVGEEVICAVQALLGTEARYVLLPSEHNGHAQLDLPSLNRILLYRCGIKEENIDICPHCTCCMPELFFSHRASGGKRGVEGSVIVL